MTDPINTQVSPYNFREVKPLSFIFEVDGALPADVCREMVRRFEARPEQQYQGRVGQQASQDQSIKKTMDLAISAQADWKDIDSILHRSLGMAIREFREKFPFFKGPFKDIGYNMQRYQAGEYYHWHIDGGSHQFADRQLVAIWYLNDVEGPGGETEFLFQDVKVKPKEGKLVLFPPFWTHEHRAVTVEDGVKYIATTWVVFA
jgi:Rps23 Pro-64 3,4-dihydroxylase Tpa1-like proline 4-hydroxylase